MEIKGYIKIYRKVLDSFIYLDSQAVHLWLHILLKANYSKKEFMFNGKRETLNKGQFITSRDKISSETNINPSKVYRLLKILEREQLIEQQVNSHFTEITVVNYLKYQGNDSIIEQQTEQPVNSQRTASEQPVNTTKEEQEVTIKKKNNKPPTPLNKKELDLSFITDAQFKEVFKKWLDYKKERQESYKPIGLKSAYNRLIKFSNSNPTVAKEIIEQAISSNYAGFFEIKQGFNNNKTNPLKAVAFEDNKYAGLEENAE